MNETRQTTEEVMDIKHLEIKDGAEYSVKTGYRNEDINAFEQANNRKLKESEYSRYLPVTLFITVPALTGSEKQIAWARRLVGNRISAMYCKHGDEIIPSLAGLSTDAAVIINKLK